MLPKLCLANILSLKVAWKVFYAEHGIPHNLLEEHPLMYIPTRTAGHQMRRSEGRARTLYGGDAHDPVTGLEQGVIRNPS